MLLRMDPGEISVATVPCCFCRYHPHRCLRTLAMGCFRRVPEQITRAEFTPFLFLYSHRTPAAKRQHLFFSCFFLFVFLSARQPATVCVCAEALQLQLEKKKRCRKRKKKHTKNDRRSRWCFVTREGGAALGCRMDATRSRIRCSCDWRGGGVARRGAARRFQSREWWRIKHSRCGGKRAQKTGSARDRPGEEPWKGPLEGRPGGNPRWASEGNPREKPRGNPRSGAVGRPPYDPYIIQTGRGGQPACCTSQAAKTPPAGRTSPRRGVAYSSLPVVFFFADKIFLLY